MATAAVTAAVAVFVSVTAPPRAVRLDTILPAAFVMGAYHVHTTRSDGTGTVDAIAAAAAGAGLRFVVFTDHGDATRPPDPPTYRHGVLCIDAVEVSTRDGHVVALGLTRAAPYPLGGASSDVIDDIHRLGGLAVIAHPDSPNPGLRWTGTAQTYDGIEWLNMDSEWRDESGIRLAAAAIRSLNRPAESIVTLAARPVRTLRRWDAAARQRAVFGLAALDAHARVGGDERTASWTTIRLPSYATMFRTVAQVAELDAPLAGNAVRDADAVLGALTAGHSYSIVRALAEPASLTFSATGAGQTWTMGQRVPASAPGPVTLRAKTEASGAAVTIFANGHPLARGIGDVTAAATGPGSYRAEAAWGDADVPWLMSNPIVIESDRPVAGVGTDRLPLSRAAEHRPLPASLAAWTVEREPSSEGHLSIDGDRLTLQYRLGGGIPRGQYAAIATAVAETAGVDRIEFVGQADRPMRVSVQVRLPGGRDGERWQRSVYLDTTPRPIVIRLQDLDPVERPTSRRPVVTPLQSLLFVVDTVNTSPGSAGMLQISQVSLGIDRLGR